MSGGECREKTWAKNGTGVDSEPASTTEKENMQLASTVDLPHSSRMECMDSEGARLIRLRCLSRLGREAFSI